MLAVSSLPPPQGIEELLAALAEHRAGLDLAGRRLRARRAGALADFALEHGERGLRALGGRHAAEALLAEQDPGLDAPALVAALEAAWAIDDGARPAADPVRAFVLASALAGALGAANLGTALAFGQIAFAATRLRDAQALKSCPGRLAPAAARGSAAASRTASAIHRRQATLRRLD